jgi:hypothetical protein
MGWRSSATRASLRLPGKQWSLSISGAWIENIAQAIAK